MKITIQTPDFKPTKKIEDLVGDHLEKLGKIKAEIIEALVCLTIDKSNTNESKVCEIRLVIPGNDMFATKQTGSFEESIVKTIDALRHQIARLKTSYEKRRNVKRTT